MYKKPYHSETPSDPVGELIVGKELNVIKIDAIPPFVNNTRIYDMDDRKRMIKFETVTRDSWSYRRFFRYLKRNYQMTTDGFQPSIATGVGSIRIELHHTPFTLLDIIYVIVAKNIADHNYADEFAVGDEVMQIHYKNMVGLYPLSPTTHELVHSEKIDIHPYIVNGNWDLFIKEYKKYFPDFLLEKADDILKWKDVPQNRIPEYLQVKYTFLQYEGIPMYKTLAIEDMSSITKELEET